MIRAITPNEIRDILFIGARFWDEGKLPGRFDPEYAERRWRGLLESGIGRIFAYFVDGRPVGGIGLFITEDINNGDRVAEEGFWFVAPEHRGIGLRLFFHAESYARASGCKRMSMVHLIDLHPEKLTRLYERSGYRCIEHAYIKNL